jgi:hypothetical protein
LETHDSSKGTGNKQLFSFRARLLGSSLPY